MKNDINNQNIRKIIGNNLRVIRINAGKSQDNVGEFLGVSFQQVQKYEHGTNRIAAEDIYRLTGFFSVNIADFFSSLNKTDEVPQDKELLKIVRQIQKIKDIKVRNKIMNLALLLEDASELRDVDLAKKKVVH